ncbi:uncharacterized protein LOC125951632 [Anopheles darlingi]|uniref:uncharacterized protein LOC125951632 n=1 Tax=Anopheles darlingi TaxID=43151 RepID=UPI00210020E3|nr:uncharacterized protein LOC125951632 [Anopheles darlingi]
MSSLGVAPPAGTISVRALSSINPPHLKRSTMKLMKENQQQQQQQQQQQLVVGDRALDLGGLKPTLKRKLPLGNYVSSSANILASSARAVGGSGRKEHLVHRATTTTTTRRTIPERTDPKTAAVSAVERRNARERNRVQQVNNGFAALRQRIPDEIAAAFEASAAPSATATPSARGPTNAHKKLSKVETLRMAVEYIKSLERLLALNDTTTTVAAASAGHPGMPQDSQLPATPPPEPAHHAGQSPAGFFLALKPRTIGNHPVGDCFDQTQITIINGHQYLRIPGTNTFHYLDPESLYGEDVAMGLGGGGGGCAGGGPRARSPRFRNDDCDVGNEDDEDVGAYDVEDEEGEEDEEEGYDELGDETLSSTVDLLSESAVALSPQSNFALDSPPGLGPISQPSSELAVGLPVANTTSATPGHGVLDDGFDQQQQQQQYDDQLMLIKSELDEDDAELADDPAFLSWIEANQQLQDHPWIKDRSTWPGPPEELSAANGRERSALCLVVVERRA